MAYLGKSPSQGVRNRYYFTASGGETSISGALTGGTLTFTDGNYVDVNLNGVTLVAGTDYNTSTANTIAGLSALTASDVVEIVVYDVFSVFSGNVNSDFSVGGNLSVTGTTAFTGATTITGLTTTGDINFGDNDKAIFGAGSDLQIYHDGSASRIVDSGTGGLTLQADANVVIQNSAGTETKAEFTTDAGVNLYYDNAAKLATTSSGVDVTGTAVVDALTCSGSATIEGTSTFGTSSADTRFNFDGPNQYRAVFKHSGNIAGQIGGGGADELRFSNAAGAIVASITGGGITFNGDTAAANALDDYEEGTWTPVLTASSGAPSSVGYSTQSGSYVKIGKMVTVWCRITLSSLSGGSGNGQISGLPYTSENHNSLRGNVGVMLDQLDSDNRQCFIQVDLSATTMTLVKDAGQGSSHAGLEIGELTGNTDIRFQYSYTV
jgi:hypothetical protein